MLHHPALYVTTSGVVAGAGVKSTRCHARGEFLGFYTGRVVDLRDDRDDDSNREEGARGRRQHDPAHSFDVARTSCAIVRVGADDVIGFVNEPPRGKTANATPLPIHLPWGNAVAYYASDTIRPHREIWAHYGRGYGRDYAVGDAGEAPRRIQRADAVLDPDVMRRETHRYCAPRGKPREAVGVVPNTRHDAGCAAHK